jgi:hypothetical protein
VIILQVDELNNFTYIVVFDDHIGFKISIKFLKKNNCIYQCKKLCLFVNVLNLHIIDLAKK